MAEFRARLRPPKNELWLGCEFTEVSYSKYYDWPMLKFKNFPYFVTLDKSFIARFGLNTHKKIEEFFSPGSIWHIESSWRVYEDTYHNKSRILV